MLKKRVVATLIIRDGIVVQSIRFRRYLPVGKPDIAVEFLNSWGVDEIIILNISASHRCAANQYDFITDAARNCFVPLTIGGGIKSVEDIRLLLGRGADKVCINSYCLATPELIRKAADVFGNQCIVVGIDALGSSSDGYRVYDASRGTATDLDVLEWARAVEDLGAGEIYLTAVDRDGTKEGYDLALIERIASAVSIPVIASGGAGHPGHMQQVMTETSASAVSAANFFHFSEHAVITAKAALSRALAPIRLDTHANYAATPLDQDYRLSKQPDSYLEDLLFEKIPKEVI